MLSPVQFEISDATPEASTTQSHHQTGEVSSAPVSSSMPTCISQPAKFVEYAALLSIFSIFGILQGSVRFADAQSTDSTLAQIHAVVELVLNVVGFMVALGVIASRSHNRDITRFFMLAQVIIALYVLIYHFFPITVDQGSGPAVRIAWDDTRHSRTFDIFILLLPCLSLHGAVFFSFARLILITADRTFNRTPIDELLDKMCRDMRAGFLWNGNLLFFGAGILTNELFTATAKGMFVYTGILTFVCAVWGINIVVDRVQPTIWFYIVSVCTILLAVFNIAVMQFSMLGSSPCTITLQASLIFTTTFMGPYAALIGRRTGIEDNVHTD